jgi:hypothetical protein
LHLFIAEKTSTEADMQKTCMYTDFICIDTHNNIQEQLVPNSSACWVKTSPSLTQIQWFIIVFPIVQNASA